MNRTFASRLTALLAAAFFFLAWGGEAVGVHACPHHTAIAGVHGAAPHGDGHHDSPGEAEHGGCTCVSGCPSLAGSLLPAHDAAIAIHAPLEWVAERPFAPTESSAPLWIPYFLPYAQAPPLG